VHVRMKLNEKIKIHGVYNEYGYNIWDATNGELLYEGGNSPFESTGTLDINDPMVEKLGTIKKYCIQTGK